MIDPWTQQIETQQPSAKPEWLSEEIERLLKAYQFPLTNDGMLMLWQKAKENLDHWKDLEMAWRKICAAFLVPAKTEGATTVPLGNNYNAKVNNKYNYKLDSNNDRVWAGLDKLEKLGNEGKFVAERLVSWSPNFLLTEYRQLQEDAEKGSQFAKEALKIIAEFMTITPAAPELKIVEPKAKKK